MNSTVSSLVLTPEQKQFYEAMLTRVVFPDPHIGQPYLAYAFLSLTPVSSPGLGTMAVDQFWRVYIDFDYAQKKGVKWAAGVLHHEIWHLLRKHHSRYQELVSSGVKASTDCWNIAGDMVINDDIPDLVPDEGVFPGKGEFKDFSHKQTTEAYYQLLVEKYFPNSSPDSQNDNANSGKENSENESLGGSQGGGTSNGEGDDSGSDTGSKKDDSLKGDGETNEDDKPDGFSTVDCGSAADGKPRVNELPPSAGGAVTETDAEVIRTIVAQEIINNYAEYQGFGASNTIGWAEEVLSGETKNWRLLLKTSIQHSVSWVRGKVDYTKKRPNRRQTNPKIFKPSLIAPQPRIGIGVDTSMSNMQNLGKALKQILDIIKQLNLPDKSVLLFSVDVKTGDAVAVKNPYTAFREVFNVGGGTNMNSGLKKLVELGRDKKIDIGLLVTDGEEYSWNSEQLKPTIPLIVCITPNLGVDEKRLVSRTEAVLQGKVKVILVKD